MLCKCHFLSNNKTCLWEFMEFPQKHDTVRSDLYEFVKYFTSALSVYQHLHFESTIDI